MTPQRTIFDEVRGTRWTQYQATFARESKRVMASVALGGNGCVAHVWVSDVALAGALANAGYTIINDQSGMRPLRTARELAEEIVMLERAVARPASILRWQKRRTRAIPPAAKRRVSPSMLRALKSTGWTWTVSDVGRSARPTFVDARIWSAYAWCLVFDDDGPSIEVGIRIDWRKKPPGPEMRDARRRLTETFAPFGYVAANVRGHFIVEKAVRDVAEARAERERIDRFLE